jgi:hypothetical protein
VERTAPDAGAAGVAALGALAAGLLTWALALSGGLELAATGIERLGFYMPRQEEAILAASGLLAGMVGDEGTMALYTRGVLDRALALRGDDTVAVLRAGLAIGGGLPMLLWTRSSLKVGLPLWLLQVAGVVAWSCLR